MTTAVPSQEKKRKTPEDATEFERDQLRFLLSEGDLATMLASTNPSLAWLPMLWQMKVVQGDTQLAAWIERNFADMDAVREVVANIRFFGPDTANVLEYRLNAQTDRLPPLLAKCWRLVIRHMRTAKHGVLQNEWFEIAPRIKRGETSADLVERVADALRPKLVLSKRLSFYEVGDEAPERPSDLMAIDYEVEDGLTPDEVLAAWPENASAETDDKLLSSLTAALSAALDDATDVGVEGAQGYGTSDSDVPSVAKHSQNEYRSGFYPIVRVMADLWERLAKKSPTFAFRFVAAWRGSPFRLVRRLALFACANTVVPADAAADILLAVPQGELFLTNSSVEIFRLIRGRWKEFSKSKQDVILQRICEGPPREWFRADGEIDRAIDRSRFDILSEMEREKFELSADAVTTLNDIRSRWPNWQTRPAEQAGFHVWHSSESRIEGDSGKLQSVPDDQLVTEAGKIAAASDFLDGDSWHALCLSDPDRALRGLDAAAASSGDWNKSLWQQLLWARKEYTQPETEARIAQLLLKWPPESFGEIASPASSWLDEHAKSLDDTLLWPLWDRIADASREERELAMRDVFTDALNSSPGRLAEVLLRKLPAGTTQSGQLPEFHQRLNKLVDAPGQVGQLARVRLAAEVSLLFERVPDWTKKKILPLFEWSSADAPAVWSARKYSNYIGSPELFGLTKKPLLEMFSRNDVSAEDLRTFSEWLTAILIANQAHQIGYPLTSTEARGALRRAGVKALSSVGHRLAVEMGGGTPEQKAVRWRTIVGPVFQAIWPLDVELQTSATTYKLAQILMATGDAFTEAADAIIPFIRPDDRRAHSTVFSIAEAPEYLFVLSPSKMLDLVAAVVGDAPPGSVYALGKALDRIRAIDPKLANTRKFQKLIESAAAA
jgi:hypothetical protein